MLNSCNLLDGHKVFNDHVGFFELFDKQSILLLEFLALLSHTLLNIGVLLVGGFEFVVEFFELGSPVFDLFLKREVFIFDLVLLVDSFFELFLHSSGELFFLLDFDVGL
jgi:hypothetical protein